MIRVLVVDDSAEVVRNVERLLYFEPDIEVVGTAGDGETGLQVARETRPDIVLLDINMPGLDGLTAAETITNSMPATQVIIMSVQDDIDFLRRAMQVGARDYMVKPLDVDEMPRKIRQVYEASRARAKGSTSQDEPVAGKVVTVFGPRGGSGCTTIAVNLALALRGFTKRQVVIADVALQFGDVAAMLNLHNQRNIADLARHIDEMDASFASDMTVSHSSGVRALLAPPRPETAELVTAEAVRRVLAALKERFDFVVVDGGHSLSDPLLAAIDGADLLLLVTTPDIPSVKNVRLMLEVLDALGFPEEKTGLVISQAGRRYGLKEEDIQRSIGCRRVASVPYDDAGPLIAANQGRPVYEMEPDAPMCRSILELAKRVTGQARAEEPVVEQAKARKVFSLWGRG